MDLDKLLHRPAVQMHLYGVHAREQVPSGSIQFTLTAHTPTETPAWVRIALRTARGLFQEDGSRLAIINEAEPRS